MTSLLEQLYSDWCPPYDPSAVPETLRSNPTNAYGLYAFERGFKLGVQLMYLALNPDDLCSLL